MDNQLDGLVSSWASPILRAAIEERLSEMSSRESARAASGAQVLHETAVRNRNIHSPWLAVARHSLDLLVGAWMNEQAGATN